jgi:hypothetical protein
VRRILLIGLLLASGLVAVGTGTAVALGPTRYHPVAAFGVDLPNPSLTANVPTTVDLTSGGVSLTPGAAVPTLPPDASVVVALRASNWGLEGIVHAYSCATGRDGVTDGVVRLIRQPGTGTASTNQVVVPMSSGHICLLADVNVDIGTIVVLGYVDADPSGLAYVDVPDRVVVDTQTDNRLPVPVSFTGGDVPDDAAAVALYITGYNASSTAQTFSIASCGLTGQQPVWTMQGFAPFTTTAIVLPAARGQCINAFGAMDLTVFVTGYYVAGAVSTTVTPPQVRFEYGRRPGFVAQTPARVLDTRTGGAPRVAAGDVVDLDLTTSVPPTATAVVLNVTATQPEGAGYASVYPCGGAIPAVSNLNFRAGQTVANAAIVGLSDAGHICLTTSAAAHLVVDLGGWFDAEAGDGFFSNAPTRVFDTRQTHQRLAAGTVFVADMSILVVEPASAVVLNVTVTNVAAPGYVTAYPCDEPRPGTSSVNVDRGQTVPNLVTVRIPSDGRLCFYSSTSVDILADISGWYAPYSKVGFVAVTPERLFDTRATGGGVPASQEATYAFRRRAQAWVMNATVTGPKASGYLTVYPCQYRRPNASNLNFSVGQTVPNLVQVTADPEGKVCFFNSAPTHYLADVAGWFDDQSIFPFDLPGADRGSRLSR